jgi:hypothetical protein
MTWHGRKGALSLLWLFCYVARTADAAMVKRNVTLTGVEYGWSAAVVGEFWNATVVSDGAVQTGVAECPPGRYCPAGSGSPLMCPVGTYSAVRRRSTACTSLCPQNSYCPDPALSVPCPNQTTSVRGARSQLDCRCQAGYQCTYRRAVNLNVGLNVPYRVWLGPSGAALRQALLRAVADSAGVPAGSVSVVRVVPGVTRPVVGRRLLGAGESAVVSLTVDNAEGVEGLRERLGRSKEFAGKGVRVHWKRADQLRVARAPEQENGQNGLGLRLFGRRT